MLSGNIGNEAKFADDYIFNAQALPSNTAAQSAAFLGGETQDSMEFVFVTPSGFTLANTQSLKIDLLGASSLTGAFSVINTPYNVTAGAAGITAAPGAELCRVVLPSNSPAALKAQLTTNAAIVGTITAYPVIKAR